MGFAETFKALSDPARREILLMLRGVRMSAGDICSHFDMTGATVSYHLSVLKKADLVFETKQNFLAGKAIGNEDLSMQFHVLEINCPHKCFYGPNLERIDAVSRVS